MGSSTNKVVIGMVLALFSFRICHSPQPNGHWTKKQAQRLLITCLYPDARKAQASCEGAPFQDTRGGTSNEARKRGKGESVKGMEGLSCGR